MDVFIEEMVNKRKTKSHILISVGSILLGILAIFFLLTVVFRLFYQFSSLIMLAVFGVIYGVYTLVTAFNIEYEYSLVNTEIDVDQITNRKKRKRLATATIRNLEAFGTTKNPDFARYEAMPELKKVYACIDKSADNTFFIVYHTGNGKAMLVFSPSERIIEQIAKRNPKIPLI
jgi:hypothetical protein